ncbi:hypothetical protein DFH94DRAFT_780794 [Russula ochroleuca]|jgi:hypothetical protein|uniref:Uncharacterized protein n=1 Tax=Russula ochroleuca TaxID=152965 RepID=A0A9P5JV97_9AGAM|nr:hypothetical protein DFH94DRAFT_780794 [Russula ochroleuca]
MKIGTRKNTPLFLIVGLGAPPALLVRAAQVGAPYAALLEELLHGLSVVLLRARIRAPPAQARRISRKRAPRVRRWITKGHGCTAPVHGACEENDKRGEAEAGWSDACGLGGEEIGAVADIFDF